MQKALKIAAGLVFVFIGFAVVAGWTMTRGWAGVNSHININGNETFQWSDGDGRRIKVRTHGKVELNEGWTAIARLPRGSEMHVEERADGVTRQLDVKPGKDGAPVYTWTVDGKVQPFNNTEGQRWLQAMLLQFVRGTGYQAEERVASILKNQGPDALLAEVSFIPGDYVKRIYLRSLLSHDTLDAAHVEQAVRQAGAEIKSDYELRQVLEMAAQAKSLSEPASLAYAEAAKKIESDYEQREALTALLNRGALSPRVLNAVLQASDEIGSDYERRQVLSTAIQSGKLQPENLAAVIRSARRIGSDYEKAEVLQAIKGRYELSGPALAAYDEAVASIGSEYERGRVARKGGRTER